MKYIAALLVNGKVFTGTNHGEAFGKLTIEEQDGEIESGFLNESTGEFLGENEMYLIRHGQAETGHWDSAISSIGIIQAEKTAEYLCQLQLNEFQGYVSPYWRCLQTADIISKKTGIRFRVLTEIREKGEQIEFIPARKSDFPNFYWPEDNSWNFQMEERTSFLQRIQRAVQILLAKCIVVSHCDFILNMTQMSVSNPPTNWPIITGGSITCIKQKKLICLGA